MNLIELKERIKMVKVSLDIAKSEVLYQAMQSDRIREDIESIIEEVTDLEVNLESDIRKQKESVTTHIRVPPYPIQKRLDVDISEYKNE